MSYTAIPAVPAERAAATVEDSTVPARAPLVLLSLILVAAVANLNRNLAVANIALPDIGKEFSASQTTLNLVAVGYSLGLAASVLNFGALGERYGRKLVLVLTMALSIPACLLAAWAPSDEVPAALVPAINFAAVPNKGALTLGLVAIALAGLIAFLIRQRRVKNPLYDLASAKLVDARLARFTLLTGYAFCLLGFLTMLLLLNDGVAYWKVGLAYALVGIGVGFAGTLASHSLTGSVPMTRAAMASSTGDLQRNLGGAIMQSILGALLTAAVARGYDAGARRGAPDREICTHAG